MGFEQGFEKGAEASLLEGIGILMEPLGFTVLARDALKEPTDERPWHVTCGMWFVAWGGALWCRLVTETLRSTAAMGMCQTKLRGT